MKKMMHGQTEKIVYNREMKLTFAHTGNKNFVNFSRNSTESYIQQ